MTDAPKSQIPVAIKIEGGSNIRLENNVSVGMPLLHAKNVENLSGTGNKIINIPSPVPVEKQWFERPLGIVFLTVVGGIVTGGLIYYFGWH